MEKTEQEDIAEVFASFFESLYLGDGSKFVANSDHCEVPAVTCEEL